MNAAKADTISKLRRDIHIRQGLQKTPGSIPVDTGLGAINHSFPDNNFPLAAVHEFICTDTESRIATTGFIAGILSSLMLRGGVVIWATPLPSLFAPSLIQFGICPEKIVFVNLVREKDLLWMLDEALKCNVLCAVVGEIRNLDFTASRRLQLAVEQSKVTGFLIRNTRHLNTTACVSRWRITSKPSQPADGLPGIGFPRWKIELLKIRNGTPGTWLLEWSGDHFTQITEEQIQQPLREAKTA